MTLVLILLPLIGFFGFFTAFSRYSDSIARRIAPDLESGRKRPQASRAPQGTLEWLRFLAKAIVPVLALVLWIRGSIPLRWVLTILVLASLARLIYKMRLKPLFERGVSSKERTILFGLAGAGLISLSYLLLSFASQQHAG
jgi:hypothetical protein